MTDMESIIGGVLAGHSGDRSQRDFWICCTCGENWPVGGDCNVFNVATEFAAHQARAVLAAISEAGAVEWGLFRKSEGPDAHTFDGSTHKTEAQARSRIERMYLPHLHDILEPRYRITITGPWTVVTE